MGLDIGLVALVGIPKQTVVVGALTGLTYALLGAGLVLVYRATRVINFAHGQIGALCAAVLAKLVLDLNWNFFLALAAVMVMGGAIGACVELGIVRRLFDAPRLLLFVATLGVAQLMLVLQFLVPDVSNTHGSVTFPSPLSWSVTIANVRLTSPELMILVLVPVVVVALGLFLERTWYGLAIRASSSNADMSELSGISTRRVSTLVWIVAGALAALTAVLLNPVRGATVGIPSAALGPGLLLPALAAGLVGGLVSLPRTLAGGIAIGVVEGILVVNFPETPGLVSLVLFVLILVLVLTRPGGADDKNEGSWSLATRVPPVPERLQSVWWVANLGRIMAALGLGLALLLAVVAGTPSNMFLYSTVVLVAVVGLSVTVLTGWAGQLSLGQFAFAGLGAVIATSLVARGFTFPIAVLYSTVAGVVVAALVGFPALRVKGLFLAVTTLAFAIATQSWLLRLDVFANGETTYHLPRTEIFGFLDLASQRTYYLLCLFVLVVAAAGVSRLRRSGVGRSIVAMRDNESSAASFGLSPAVSKLTAFAFAGGLAALAGALMAGLQVFYSIDSTSGVTLFGPEQSLQVVAMAVIGGLGSVSGTLLGALYVVGLPALFDDSQTITFATSGIGLLALLLYLPGGLAGVVYRIRGALFTIAERRLPPEPARPPMAAVAKVLPQRAAHEAPESGSERPDPTYAIEATNVNVRFGGLKALDGVSINCRPGEMVGLIGSNGAGKSTLMNVISGFQGATEGTVSIWGEDVTALPPYERARMGVGRVFQDARLFGDLSLRETVKVALEIHERSEFVPSLLGYPPARRAERRRTVEAAAYIDFLGLGRYADTFVSDLSTGTRRVVEFCCLLAQGSRLLLLDEPTAGVAQRETEAFGPLIGRIRAELGATILIIEHDMPLVMSISDRVYCFDAGRNIAEGTPEEVRSDPAVIAAYLGTDERAIARSGARAVVDPELAASEEPSGNGQRERTRPELLARAAELGIPGGTRLGKQALIEAIADAELTRSN
jgi:ABC-type branched-subunit amino acid transport system ATPase component/ABC-type branched-subunit amino acid transport system permease subunit